MSKSCSLLTSFNMIKTTHEKLTLLLGGKNEVT